MKKVFLFILLFIGITIGANAQIWEQVGDINGDMPEDRLGRAVSISKDGLVIAVGAFESDDNRGMVKILRNNAEIWTQIGDNIVGEESGDFFGWSISLNYDGSIVAIGARLNDGNGDMAGHVRVYENIDDTWIQIGEDIDGEAAEDESGYAVSLSYDGSVVAIAAGGNNDSGYNAGHVRIYKNIEGTWTQVGEDIDGEAAEDQFGSSVSLSSDGSIVAVGAGWNDGGGDKSGHVRVFQNINNNWIQLGGDIDGEGAGDKCGVSTCLSSNGLIVAIGAYGNDDLATDAGHVRIYENFNGSWIQIGEDIDGEAEGDYSGFSIGFNSDGSIVAIGAYLNDGDNGDNNGHVRVYQNIQGNWLQMGQDIDGEYFEGELGKSVSLSSDGYTLVVGADKNNENGYNSGQARIFHFNPEPAVVETPILTNILIFPNPTDGIINISQIKDAKLITVSNVTGRKIITKKAENKKEIIDLSNYQSGVYFISIQTNNKIITTKIIKK